jgi:PEP-CTERM motif
MQKTILGLLTLGILFGAFSGRADADIVAATYAGGGTAFNFPDATGYYFTPNTNLTVTSLGYFDLNPSGLASNHDVGIFLASNGSAVATGLVSAGTVDPLIDGSRFVSIAPVTLTAGTQYYTVADNNTIDQYVFGNGAVIYNPAITWNGFSQSATNSIFSTTFNGGGVPGNLGPNFQFQGASSTPEPASLTLLGTGLLAFGGLGLRRWRRRPSAT